MRHSNLIDTVIAQVDSTLRTIFPPTKRNPTRPSPADKLPDCSLSLAEKKHTAGLMRVNHAGEVAAQALYQSQALTARTPDLKLQMQQASDEETDHLAWCEQRLIELNSQPSILNPLWYAGAFCIGTLAGLAGDHFNLGFVAETEKQVSEHLEKHIKKLSITDQKTNAILKQMQQDEMAHADKATHAGAADLPLFIKILMSWASKIMTKSSYYI